MMLRQALCIMTQTETATLFNEGEIKDVIVYPLKKYTDERNCACKRHRGGDR